MRHARGFTLIELLVALSITALIMAIAYGGLGALSKQADSSRATMLRLRQVQLAMDIISRDFAQLEPRPVRDGLGAEISPALVAGPSNVPPIEFTRGGWGNPLGTLRSTEERVAYSLEDGKLMRSWWPELDGQAQVQPIKEALLADVSSIKLQYMEKTSKSFQDVWPPTQTLAPGAATHGATPGGAIPGPAPGGAVLPVAVSITVTLRDLGDMTRVVEVSSCVSNCF
jgi:general secretion pathway protein J